MDICMHVRTSCQTVYPVANTIKKLYKRTKRTGARTIDEVEEEYFPGFKAFIDSSEQEIPRPKNKRKEKEELLLLWQKEERNILLSRHNILW